MAWRLGVFLDQGLNKSLLEFSGFCQHTEPLAKPAYLIPCSILIRRQWYFSPEEDNNGGTLPWLLKFDNLPDSRFALRPQLLTRTQECGRLPFSDRDSGLIPLFCLGHRGVASASKENASQPSLSWWARGRTTPVSSTTSARTPQGALPERSPQLCWGGREQGRWMKWFSSLLWF